MIVPCESHFTDWTSDCCCPSHWIQRLTGTLCPAERLPYHTGSGVQQLFTNGGALIAFLRMLEWGTFILLLACGCLLLSALHPCLASSGIFPGTSIPSPHPVFRQEVRPSAGKLCWHPGCPAQLKEEGHFLSLWNFCGYSWRTQHISWKMRGQGLPNLWLQGFNPSHVWLILWTLDHQSSTSFQVSSWGQNANSPSSLQG